MHPLLQALWQPAKQQDVDIGWPALVKQIEMLQHLSSQLAVIPQPL